jgi:hypothetical protein
MDENKVGRGQNKSCRKAIGKKKRKKSKWMKTKCDEGKTKSRGLTCQQGLDSAQIEI